ncbi:MAG: beta-propeller domain-containing protein, partial [Ruminiclostridium sp.]|nr:beta-propeller domain-containing protein [Ruminiclostridium sp.]
HEPDLNRTNEFSLKGEEPKTAAPAAAPSQKSEEAEEKEEKPQRKLLFGRRKNEDLDEEDIDLSEDDSEDIEEEKKKKKKRKKRKKDIEEDDDIEPSDDIPYKKSDKRSDNDLDDDFDDEEDEHRSNGGKFAAAAIGAVLLIGLSFGLRYYFTGSIMPNIANNDPVNDNDIIDVNEEKIFDLISAKPEAALSGYTPIPAYTAGGVREESCLKQIIAAEKRLVCIMGNSLYIFEQIGGQTAQLDVRNYPSDVALVGLVETEKGIAVISENDGEPYSFVRTEGTGEEGSAPQTVTDTVVRPETVIELLDKDNPEKRAGIAKYRLSGHLSDIYRYSERLIVLTEENIPQNASKEDFVTFMPFILTNEGRKLCSAENSSASKDPANSVITAAFSLTFEGENAMACTAGDPVKAVALCNGNLYLGTGNRLIKLAADGDLSEKGRYTAGGTFEDFSAIGVDSTGGVQLVRATFKGEQGTDLAVLDTDMKLVGEVKNLGSGETAAATCFYRNETYIVTESGACFGVDGGNQVITESVVKITGSDICPLSAGGNALIGIKVTPVDENGKRAALTVSTVKLDGTGETLNSTSVSSKTVAKNALDEYLSSPAENGAFAIGSRISDSGAGVVVVPAVYFDGVSEVELFVIYNVSAEGNLSVNGTVAYYDGYSKHIFSVVKGEYVIAVTDKMIITAKAENGSVTGYYELAESDDVYNY